MHSALRLVVAAFAITLTGCSGTGTAIGVNPMSSSAASPVTVSIALAGGASTPAASAFRGGLCQVGPTVVGSTVVGPTFFSPFNLVVVAASTVDMNTVTLRLIDGSSVGGPTITFPQAQLTSLFGTTIIVGGTTRVFTLQPLVTCGATPWRTVSAQMAFRDSGGAMHVVTADTPLR